jgi:hypothetical protein
MNRKLEILKAYTGTLTSILVGLIWFWLTLKYSHMDVLEIVAVYALFIMIPAYFIPYVLTDDTEDDENRTVNR